jgi:hypothetical protein
VAVLLASLLRRYEKTGVVFAGLNAEWADLSDGVIAAPKMGLFGVHDGKRFAGLLVACEVLCVCIKTV